MFRVISSLTKQCSRLSIQSASSHNASFNLSSPTSSLIVPSHVPPAKSILDEPFSDSVAGGSTKNVPVHLPALENARQVYTFPTMNRSPILAPAPFLQQTIEKMDPQLNKTPIEAPPCSPPITIQLAPRLLTIRRKKMKKHKRRKRYDRDFFKYQKYHREKKLKAEREFVKRMNAHLAELKSFEPEKYVDQVIADAKKEWSDDLTPTGKKLYPHWSRLMTLEELYGLPHSDYIDKRAGLPSEEDQAKLDQLKKEYASKYRNV